MIVTEALNSLKEKMFQRANDVVKIFSVTMLLDEQYLTSETVFAGKPNVESIHFQG